eukprot:SAG11_NODE_37874_length_254_cov_99.432258_1_plen_26_part_01
MKMHQYTITLWVAGLLILISVSCLLS